MWIYFLISLKRQGKQNLTFLQTKTSQLVLVLLQVRSIGYRKLEEQ